jgi:hypothetical protein
MPKVLQSDHVSRRGIAKIASVCAEMGYLWRETNSSDVGLDGEIEIVESGKATGKIIKVQSKAGSSYIRGTNGSKFRVYVDVEHCDYWAGVINPVIAIIYDPQIDAAYWIDIKKSTTGNRSRRSRVTLTFDRKRDAFTAESRKDLVGCFGPTFEEAFVSYRRSLADHLETISTSSAVFGNSEVSFDEFFVPPVLLDTDASEAVPSPTGHGWQPSSESTSELLLPFDLGSSCLQDKARVSIWTVLASHRNLLIEAGPGSGKSTLLRYIARSVIFHHAKPSFPLTNCLLPILVPLRDFNRFFQGLGGNLIQPAPHHLADFLQKHASDYAPSAELSVKFFAQALSDGKCIVLLDALDEVADFHHRLRIVEAVISVVKTFSTNRFVITSRPFALEAESRHQLKSRFATRTILDLTPENRTAFIRNCCTAVQSAAQKKNLPEASLEDSIESIEAQIIASPDLQILSKTPLLLSLICTAYCLNRSFPCNRAELYGQCCKLLLGFWDRDKGGEEARALSEIRVTAHFALAYDDKMELIEQLALWLHERAEATLPVAERELLDHIDNLLHVLFDLPRTKSRKRAKLVLDRLIERSSLLVKNDNESYAFFHLNFQEYLAGRAIANSDDHAERILRVLHKSWWQEVIFLSVEHLCFTRDSGAKAMVSSIIRRIEHSGSWLEEPLRRDLLFACRAALRAGIGNVELALAEDLFDTLLEVSLQNPFERLEREIRSILYSARRTFVGVQLRTKCFGIAEDEQLPEERRSKACNAIFAMLTFSEQAKVLTSMVKRDRPFEMNDTDATANSSRTSVETPAPPPPKDPGDDKEIHRTTIVETPEQLLELMEDSRHDVRWRAATKLGLMQDSACSPRVLSTLFSDLGNPGGRGEMAIVVLSLLRELANNPETCDEALKLTFSPLEEVRLRALKTLQYIQAPISDAAIKRLLELTRDPAEELRCEAVVLLTEALSCNVEGRIVACFIELCQDASILVRAAAAEGLAQSKAVTAEIARARASAWMSFLPVMERFPFRDYSRPACDKGFDELHDLADGLGASAPA